jgi:hypothetical protein
MKRLLVLAAIAAGLVAGTVVAAAQPDRTAPPPQATPRLPPITEAPARKPIGRLPDGRYDPGYSHYIIEPGSLEIAATIEDPGGGPAWAIRTYRAERRTITRPARTLDDYAFRQAYRCVELGRVMNGRFGWVYGDRRFRPHEPSAVDQLAQCTSRKRPQETHRHETVAVFPSPSEPEIVRGAVWGLAAPKARSATLEGGAGGPQPLILHDGAFLALVGPDVRRGDLRLTFGLRGGGSETTRVDRVPRLRGRVGEQVPGTERIEARAPDPAGGPGWGVAVADRRGGGVCVGGAGQVVGDTIGAIDTDLALVTTYPFVRVNCRPPGEGPTRDRPLWAGYGGGSGDPNASDPLLRRARIERRVLPGRFELLVECHRSVERVTIRSPRDIRTLIPSERGHVVFALYDGGFPAGQIVLTAHLRSGGRFVERLPIAF